MHYVKLPNKHIAEKQDERNQSELIKALGRPMEYTCPKCGSPVQHTVLCSYPGQDKYKCTRCDYLKVIPQQIRTQVAPT